MVKFIENWIVKVKKLIAKPANPVRIEALLKEAVEFPVNVTGENDSLSIATLLHNFSFIQSMWRSCKVA